MQRLVLQRDGPRADGVEQRAVVGDQQQRALVALQRLLQRLAALEVQMVGGLVEDQDVRARVDEDRQRQPPPLAAAQPVERLLGLLAAEEERPSSERAWLGVSLVARWEASSTVPVAPISSACCDEQPELDVVPAAQLAAVELAQRRPAR